uniref:Uncharacterized protein n=1 Tax=Anguilla anguilla TaxID=7936 RepID=A0A0E9QY32_ANGAN
MCGLWVSKSNVPNAIHSILQTSLFCLLHGNVFY